MESFAENLGSSLSSAGWQEADIGVAVFAQAVAMMANASELRGCGGDIAGLKYLGGVVSRIFPGFKLSARKSL